MASPKSAWRIVDLSPALAVANQSQLVLKPAPCAGRIVEIWVDINTLLTTGGGTLALAKGAANILSTTSINLQADLTAATAKKYVKTPNTASGESYLAQNDGTLRVAAGDALKATWTLTTVAVTNGASCLVVIEPDEW